LTVGHPFSSWFRRLGFGDSAHYPAFRWKWAVLDRRFDKDRTPTAVGIDEANGLSPAAFKPGPDNQAESIFATKRRSLDTPASFPGLPSDTKKPGRKSARVSLIF
jgi:hypothetical protein